MNLHSSQQEIDRELPPSAVASPAPPATPATRAATTAAVTDTTAAGGASSAAPSPAPGKAVRRASAHDQLQALHAAQESLHSRFNEMHRELGPQAMTVFAEVNTQPADIDNVSDSSASDTETGPTPTPRMEEEEGTVSTLIALNISTSSLTYAPTGYHHTCTSSCL